MFKKRYHKYYHPKNKFFLLHIMVDAGLAVLVLSLLALNFNFWTRPNYQPIGNQTNSTISTKIDRQSNESQPADRREIIRKKIAAELKVNAEARYTTLEGDQLGVGPIPPVVGQKTKYWIFLSVATDYHEVKNISLTATLPPEVILTGKTATISETGIQYDLSNRQINWQIKNLSIDQTVPEGAAFEVAINPTESDTGKILTLLSDIKISGVDDLTGKTINANMPDITTAIKEDISGGQVIVKPNILPKIGQKL